MMNKRTKIVCTVGPACEETATLVKMIEAGMNVARLNFSHGSYEHHEMLIEHIKEAAEQTGQVVSLLQDLQGPKIRVGEMPEEGVALESGASVIFDTSLNTYAGEVIPVDWELLHEFVKPGERLLLNDGKMECIVERVEGTQIHATVKVPGQLTSHKGMNVPDSTISVRAMTEKDKADAKFGVEHGVDYIALSFVMSAEDVVELRNLIEQYQKELGMTPKQPIHIITKIERAEAVACIDDILDVADGLMVARGDLGVEMPAEKVPVLQKELIEKALEAHKPVIVATQMLDSMQDNPRPTRAEVSDVANAVIDHTDAVMLSNESAVGKYPVETVDMMARAAYEAEVSKFDNLPFPEEPGGEDKTALGALARVLAEKTQAKAIVAASADGAMARMIARYRPELPIVVASSEARTVQQMNLIWGVLPLHMDPLEDEEQLLAGAGALLHERDIASSGDPVIMISGTSLGHSAEHIEEIALP